MTEDRFWQLVSRKMAGEISREELLALENALEQHPQWQTLYDALMAENEKKQVDAESQLEADQAYAAHYVQMQVNHMLPDQSSETETYHQKDGRKKTKKPLVVTISLITAAAACWLFFINKRAVDEVRSDATPTNIIATKKGSRSNVTLPDGTQVWLNADSRIQYSENFQGKTREVTLIGEAYFDVMKDSSRPFVIHTEKINIKVLGTAFNVKSYPQDDKVETALIHGKIEVTFKDRPSEKLILKPNEKLVLNKNQEPVTEQSQAFDGPKIQIENIRKLPEDSIYMETAWMQNRLAFTRQRLEDIAHDLERRFNVSIVFENEEVKHYRYTGLFENESLEKILDVMKMSKSFQYKILNKKVIISL